MLRSILLNNTAVDISSETNAKTCLIDDRLWLDYIMFDLDTGKDFNQVDKYETTCVFVVDLGMAVA